MTSFGAATKRWAIAAIGLLAVAGNAHADAALADVIEAGDRKAALEMIRSGTDVNAAQGDGTTPLHWAVYKVDEELTRTLLERGAKADVRNNFGASLLVKPSRLPTQSGEDAAEGRADVEATNDDGQMALMLAARAGQ
jgi:ankyrin repeat protein